MPLLRKITLGACVAFAAMVAPWAHPGAALAKGNERGNGGNGGSGGNDRMVVKFVREHVDRGLHMLRADRHRLPCKPVGHLRVPENTPTPFIDAKEVRSMGRFEPPPGMETIDLIDATVARGLRQATRNPQDILSVMATSARARGLGKHTLEVLFGGRIVVSSGRTHPTRGSTQEGFCFLLARMSDDRTPEVRGENILLPKTLGMRVWITTPDLPTERSAHDVRAVGVDIVGRKHRMGPVSIVADPDGRSFYGLPGLGTIEDCELRPWVAHDIPSFGYREP